MLGDDKIKETLEKETTTSYLVSEKLILKT